MPIGVPRLLQAQLAGVSRAAKGSGARVHLNVRHLRDSAEIDMIRTMRESLAADEAVPVGAYLTSPRAVTHLGSMVRWRQHSRVHRERSRAV